MDELTTGVPEDMLTILSLERQGKGEVVKGGAMDRGGKEGKGDRGEVRSEKSMGR